MWNKNLFQGVRREYPVKLYDGLETEQDIIIHNDNELVDCVYNMIAKLKSKDKPLEDSLHLLCFNLHGYCDTMQLFDNRTKDIIEKFLYYRYSPMPNNPPKIWFDSVIELQKIFEPRLM